MGTRVSSFPFVLFYIEGNQTCFADSSDSDTKKLVANAVLESTKKSKNVYAHFSCDMKIIGRVTK